MLDADLFSAEEKTKDAANTFAAVVDVTDDASRQKWIAEADVVISLLPPALHFKIAVDCLHFSKNLLTASYVDANLRSINRQVTEKGLLFLCEMGLDPGIDHMSAMKIINRLRADGANITSFRSHCGGLVAPESDDNPWRYKVSWNPRNIVMAGKAGAIFRQNGGDIRIDYEGLFDPGRLVNVDDLGSFSWYPNRDSSGYAELYGLESASTFVRTTLRYPEFCFGWKNIIELKLTDEEVCYDTSGMSLQKFFQQHLKKHGFSEWIDKRLTSRFSQSKELLEKLEELMNAEGLIDEHQLEELGKFMLVDRSGELLDVDLEDVKQKAAATIAAQMHEANLSLKQLFFLGMDDDATIINRGQCSAADVLQFALEKKLALKDGDKDMVVMLHEIDYEHNDSSHAVKSSLIVKGEDNIHTAMAKTVGLPLAIATKLVLEGKVPLSGVHIPVHPVIYEPVLAELEMFGIKFAESES